MSLAAEYIGLPLGDKFKPRVVEVDGGEIREARELEKAVLSKRSK